MEEGRSAFKILTGRLHLKERDLYKASRCEGNIKLGLKEIGVNTRIWIDLAQDRDYCRVLEYTALNLRTP